MEPVNDLVDESPAPFVNFDIGALPVPCGDWPPECLPPFANSRDRIARCASVGKELHRIVGATIRRLELMAIAEVFQKLGVLGAVTRDEKRCVSKLMEKLERHRHQILPHLARPDVAEGILCIYAMSLRCRNIRFSSKR